MEIVIIKRRFFTLIEMIIVITLIGLIAGALLWRMQGALEKGKAFKTEMVMKKLETVLSLSKAENPTLDIQAQWEDIVRASPLVDKVEDFIYDAWGKRYQISEEDGFIIIQSEGLQDYKQKNPL